MGHDATAVERGQDAVAEFTRGGYDLVFLDLKMPGMTGWTPSSDSGTRIRR